MTQHRAARRRPAALLTDADVRHLLRAADPAGAGAGSGGGLDTRARADLAGIIASDATASTGTSAAPETTGPVPLGPSTRRTRRRPLLLAGLPAAATALVAVALVIGAGQPRGDALASWSPVPATAPGAQVSRGDVETWASRCTDITRAAVGIGGVSPHTEQAAAREVLVDRRGDFTYCVDFSLGRGTDADPLVALVGLRGGDVQETWATVYSSPVSRPTGERVLALGGDSTTTLGTERDGSPSGVPEVCTLYGLAGPGVSGVDVVLANGLRVTTTLQHGVWAAWWPGRRGSPVGATLAVHSSTGQQGVDPSTVGLDGDR